VIQNTSLRTGVHTEATTPLERAKLIVLDEDRNIVAAERGALELLGSQLPSADFADELDSLFENLTPELAQNLCPAFTMGPLLLQVAWLQGTAHSYYAVFVELRVRVDDLRDAPDRYGLTKRETEVLSLIIRGYRGSEIAQMLCITLATVNDHFKSLRRKTGARSRSEMLIKVLGRHSAVVAHLP
jgi:DNA-binding CsgD family transcriptional regulator